MSSRPSSNRIPPGPGQESVWDYPRPPRLEATPKRLQVFFADDLIADTARGYRVLETSHPPTYYIPRADVKMERLRPADGSSFCEWKGAASYFDVRGPEADAKQADPEKIARRAAWCYSNPSPAFAPIKDYLCFYAHMMDRCLVAGEEVQAQIGGFYGGWVTSDIVGPFKGAAGTMGW
ncbi:MAG: DUF427 domain-containing protein [bacterium]|nr:DUF427 domain-containing protein [bacterium]